MATGRSCQVLFNLDFGICRRARHYQVIYMHYHQAHRFDQEIPENHCLGFTSSDLGIFPCHVSRDFALLPTSSLSVLVDPRSQATGHMKLICCHRESRIDSQWRGPLCFC